MIRYDNMGTQNKMCLLFVRAIFLSETKKKSSHPSLNKISIASRYCHSYPDLLKKKRDPWFVPYMRQVDLD